MFGNAVLFCLQSFKCYVPLPLFEYLCSFAFYIRGSLLGLKFSYQTSFGIWLYQYLLVCLGIISTTPEDYLMSTSDLYYVFHI